MSVNNILPWLEFDWGRLWTAPSGLPHALLLAGPPGLGKREFAVALAQRLLCESSTGSDPACGKCDACRWFEAGNHPDFRLLVPEVDAEEVETEDAPAKTEKADKKKSKQIKVDQVRALADFVYVGAHRGKGRVIIVQPAEAMNSAAANSLLKILEEPPSSVYFILISDAYKRLLPTIRSRCSQLLLARPEPAAARAWLKKTQPDAADLLDVTGGMPLRALATAEQGWKRIVGTLENSLADIDQDELALASTWEGLLKAPEAFAMEDLITLLQKWLGDLLLRQLAGRTRFFATADKVSATLLARTSVPALLHCYNQLQSARPLANHPLNARLFLEDIAARYLHAFAAKTRSH